MAIIIHFDIAAAAAVVIAFRFQHFSMVALAAFEIYQQQRKRKKKTDNNKLLLFGVHL